MELFSDFGSEGQCKKDWETRVVKTCRMRRNSYKKREIADNMKITDQ